MVFEMTTIIKLNHVASHHLHHHYQRNVVFGRKIYNHHAIIYYLFIVCKKKHGYRERVCWREIAKWKWRRDSGREKMVAREIEQERQRVCQECVQLTFSVHICGEPSTLCDLWYGMCARNEEPLAHTNRYSLKCVYAHP